MVDAALTQVIESVTSDKVQAGEMFTAYDVSKEVQKRGHRERHNNMKVVVHDYYVRGAMGADYTRTLIPVAGAPTPPFVYHRNTDDPTTYQASPSDPAAVTAAVGSFYAQGTVAVQDATDSGDDEDDGTVVLSPPASLPSVNGKHYRKPDARGTVCIPAKYLRTAGFSPKDKACIWAGGNSLRVVKPTTGGKPLATYTVDSNNNVRITKHTLDLALGFGFPNAVSGYDFDEDNHEVLVKAN